MKRIVILFLFTFLISSANAQFKTYKNNYEVKNYSWEKGDNYNPAIAGGLALIFPGAGHIYTNQIGRGLVFLGSMAGSLVFTTAGFILGWSGSPVGIPMFFAGGISFVGIYIWNFIDAIRVAKIKNMAFRDKKISLNAEPYIINNLNNSIQPNSAGLKLTLKF